MIDVEDMPDRRIIFESSNVDFHSIIIDNTFGEAVDTLSHWRKSEGISRCVFRAHMSKFKDYIGLSGAYPNTDFFEIEDLKDIDICEIGSMKIEDLTKYG